MGAYTIRELENLSGIKAHTIRIWEKRYGLITPHRTSTNIRTYCDSELKKLLNVSILNRYGLKISKIAQLSEEEIALKIRQFTHDNTSVESQIEGLTFAMIDLDEHRFEQLLAKSIIQFGFEEAVVRIVYPFLNRIGLLWQTGSITSVQEHFISNLVKQKFLESEHMPRFVFFLPEGEMHEIGLLFSCYLARKHGFRTIYLGQSLPVNDLVGMVKKKQVDYLYTSLTSSYNGQNPDDYVRLLSDLFPAKVIYVSGSQIHRLAEAIPDNVKLMNEPDQFIHELNLILRS